MVIDHNYDRRIGVKAWIAPSLLAVLSLIGGLGLGLRPPADGPVAIVFPPWWGQKPSMEAAATIGRIVRFGAASFIVVIMPEGPDVQQRLRNAGAWISLDPRSLGGCMTRDASDWGTA